MQTPTSRRKGVKEEHSNGEEEAEKLKKERHGSKKSSRSLGKQETTPVNESEAQDKAQEGGKVCISLLVNSIQAHHHHIVITLTYTVPALCFTSSLVIN